MFILVAVLFFISMLQLQPSVASAAQDPEFTQSVYQSFAPGLIPCGTAANPTPCNACHVFSLAQNVLNFLWWSISLPLATLMLAYGGFLMVIPGVGGEKSAAMLSKGKKVLTNTLVGIAIIFFAWLGIDTIIKTVGGQNIGSGTTATIFPNAKTLGPWNKITCQVSTLPTGTSIFDITTSGQTQASTPKPVPSETQKALCPTCVTLGVESKTGFTCAGSASGQVCMVDSTLNQRLQALNSALGGVRGYWWVTEAWPPTVVHQNPCHQNGTCVDANLRGSAVGNPADITNFIQKADSTGLSAIYEVTSQARKDTLVQSGVPASNILVETKITGEHFSVYLK